DPAPGMVLMLHKPVGYTCSTKDPGRLVYDLLPERFRCRKPALSTIGRLDRETSGLLLLTDDGALLHRVIAPKSRVGKVYRATLAENLRGDEAAVFAAGTLLLEGETEPLAPATLEVFGQREVLVTLYEGRYHQVRRMFAAIGNHVTTLERQAVGGLRLAGLPEGQWQLLDAAEAGRIFCAGSAVSTADTGG
nr:pseudouridine synthase [Sterolibacterium sp.]